MNGETHLRWNPLAVLGRWRQLLWLTPLAALLTSLIWHLLSSKQPGPLVIHGEPVWQGTPWSERLQSFNGSAAPVFWGSLCLALGLAYLAEALEPRRTRSGRNQHPLQKHP